MRPAHSGERTTQRCKQSSVRGPVWVPWIIAVPQCGEAVAGPELAAAPSGGGCGLQDQTGTAVEYADLYAVLAPIELDTIRSFLHCHTFPQVMVTEREVLRALIVTAEIWESLRELARDKTPGFDGLPMEFYSISANRLLP
ncbi:hypothetical protein NDU88_007454 [Pleurodeles waltl]|uniref:Uncharacterized protein n=1 Tax=Pleurodeles waltl TaxID=8319 RepID=A0AAV7RQC5_PLEWA|nr:hypothetical protein NDU88_007454 [Pleurodeles waltl]